MCGSTCFTHLPIYFFMPSASAAAPSIIDGFSEWHVTKVLMSLSLHLLPYIVYVSSIVVSVALACNLR